MSESVVGLAGALTAFQTEVDALAQLAGANSKVILAFDAAMATAEDVANGPVTAKEVAADLLTVVALSAIAPEALATVVTAAVGEEAVIAAGAVVDQIIATNIPTLFGSGAKVVVATSAAIAGYYVTPSLSNFFNQILPETSAALSSPQSISLTTLPSGQVTLSNETAVVITPGGIVQTSSTATGAVFDPGKFAGAIDVAGVSTVQTSGAITLASGSVGTLIGKGDSVTFSSGSSLDVADPKYPTGTLFNFVPSDTIDLEDIGTATSATLAPNNVLTVTGASGGTITLQLDPTQNYTGDSFNVSSDGAGGTDISVVVAPTLKTLAKFNWTNGANPESGLIIDSSSGDLFGTTLLGGAGVQLGGGPDGTVFKITASGTLTTLASFNGNAPNGNAPVGGLVEDKAGDLFGTTSYGGAYGYGTVFEIAKAGVGYAAPKTLVSFYNPVGPNKSNGGVPKGNLVAYAGNLFGTTSGGGSGGGGTVFEISPTGALTTLVSFSGTNGYNPQAGLITDSAGNLFGTTNSGGANGDGTVFEIAKTATGYVSTPKVLANFNRANSGAFNPQAGLVMDAAGDLFGTTNGGGPLGSGTVFEIKKIGSVYAATPTILVNFTGSNGSHPVSGLIVDAAGNLFGTTNSGGPSGSGMVFEIKTAATATGYASTPTTLVNFTSNNGAAPIGSLVADAAGDLFGTTYGGGTSGYGTVFEITNSGFVTAASRATAAAATAAPLTTVAASSTLNVTGTESIASVLDDGTVAIASGGSLDVTSAVDPSSTGIFQLTTKASLEIAAVLGTGLKIQFLGSSPVNDLLIDSASSFGTQVGTASYAGPLLEGFAAGDMIDLKGIANNSLNLAYTSTTGDLQITGSSGDALATLTFQNSTLGAGAFHAASDGSGGTLITHG